MRNALFNGDASLTAWDTVAAHTFAATVGTNQARTAVAGRTAAYLLIGGAVLAVGTATQWLSNFVVTVSFPVLLGVNIGLVYGLFAFFAMVSFFFALKCMKETKGVALEDMQA